MCYICLYIKYYFQPLLCFNVKGNLIFVLNVSRIVLDKFICLVFTFGLEYSSSFFF